ncbi:uncharacterized protein BP5553_03293 [Venustampulla echinocandica]|uniref:SP-RING-type domain-containing protein n=1 Tax=Venustampulla echinocandica TaxID=2656787 RepID=A0A370TTV6_9HELO|nr:uncharacterized protein BP5553_03293 [Venustampulla echinocandica]RDL38953.1 hypothetical protein BP5553_03293 [Venustampulla echinocandica]
MRRPPDKDRIRNAVLSERDVVSSNATLNAVFGGARQKSWMVAAGTPVRPSPRPGPSKPESYQGPSAQRPGSGVLPSPAPSDESSPALSGALASGLASNNHNQRQTSAHENSRAVAINRSVGVGSPSGTASSLQAAVSSPHSPSRQPQQQAQRQQEAEPQPQPQPQLQLDPQYQARGQKGPPIIASPTSSVTTANAAIPSSILDHTDGPHNAWSPPEVEIGGSRPERQILSPSPLTSECSPSPPPDRQAGQALPNSQAQQGGHQPTSLDGSNIMSQGWQAFSRPSPSTVLPISQASSSPPIHSSTLHEHQRTTDPALPSLRPLKGRIEQHIESVGGRENLNNGLERPRFQLLQDACCKEDYFYIALHQIFCTWDLPGPTRVTSIPDFPSSKILLTSFKTLGSLIRENDGLAPNHKKWFAQFPGPIEMLMKASEPYRRNVVYVGIFLRTLPAEWRSLAAACANRGYPPLVDELVSRLGVLSPILQDIMFTAAQRNLALDDGVLGVKIVEVFKRDRREWDALRARCHTSNPPKANEQSDRNFLIGNEYRKLVGHKFHQQGHPTATGRSPLVTRIPTPVHSSACVQSPTSATSLGAQTPAIGPWSQNNPNPSLNAHWDSVPQVPQTGGTTTNDPSIIPISGFAPGILGQHAYTDLSSPSPVQGLSVQSPVQLFHPDLSRNDGQVEIARDATSIIPSNSNGPIRYSQIQNSDPRMEQMQQLFVLQQQQQQQNAARQARQHLHRLQQQQQQQQNEQVGVGPQYPQHQYPQHQIQQVQFSNPTPERRGTAPAVVYQQAINSRTTTLPSNDRRATEVAPWPRPAMPGPPGLMAGQVTSSTRQKPKHHLDRPLLPPLPAVQATYPANPSVFALHQAHLRSPILAVPDISYLEKAQDDPSRRFYQTVKDLSFGPTKILEDSRLTEFDFKLSADELALIPRDVFTGSGKLSMRELKRGSLQYRMRCIQPKLDIPLISVADWIVSDTSWPESCFLSLNQAPLEIRRKTHHGKDLPIDITQHVLASGDGAANHIAVAIPLWTKSMKGSIFVAIERVELLQHGQIMDMCLRQQRIPYSQTLDAIKTSLAPKDIDEDLAIVDSDLVLGLADPFTARVFEIPVRGSSCLHHECFDLETFLMTRSGTPKRPQQPCMADVWKCPLCGKDARPYSLRVDEFLMSVRADLTVRNELDVKAILISPDGRWRSKPEPQGKRKATDEPDDDSSEDERVKKRDISAIAMQQNKNKMVEVIQLDDD